MVDNVGRLNLKNFLNGDLNNGSKTDSLKNQPISFDKKNYESLDPNDPNLSPELKAAIEEYNKTQTEIKKFADSTTNTKKADDISESMNSDGSGTKVEKKVDKNGNEYEVTSTFGAGGVLEKRVTKFKNSTVTSVYTNNDKGKPVSVETTTENAKGEVIKKQKDNYTYNEDGKILTQSGEVSEVKTKNGKKYTEKTTYTKENEYKDGKLVKSTLNQKGKTNKTVISTYNKNEQVEHQDIKDVKMMIVKGEDGKLQLKGKETKSTIDYEYHNNKVVSKKIKTGTDSIGKPTESTYHYDENGKLSSLEKKYYKHGVKVEEKFVGANLENRFPRLPSERFTFESDGKTIKSKTVNEFDKDGILVSQKIYDKDEKEIASHDFSKIDGKFDTSYQGGTGDCYLLAAINALASTEAGAKMLADNIKVTKDENGKNVYTVSFPGSEKARESLINGTGDTKFRKLPEDKVFIQGSYTITEDELREASKKAGSKYSIGDKDVLLMEVAYEKYRNDVAKTLKANNLQSVNVAGLLLSKMNGDVLSGGLTEEAIFAMTGKASDCYDNKNKTPVVFIDGDLNLHVADDNGNVPMATKAIAPAAYTKNDKLRDEMIKNIIDDSKDGKLDHYAASVIMKISQQEVNGQVIQGGNHAFTILKMTADTVTLVNPWDSSKPIEMSMSDFKKAAARIQCVPVDKDGKKILQKPSAGNTNGNNSQIGQVTGTYNYTVPKGQTYTGMIKQALIKQGIQPTAENIKKAKQEFEKLNPKAVKTYRGPNKKWLGNKYLLAGAKVKIPQFN